MNIYQALRNTLNANQYLKRNFSLKQQSNPMMKNECLMKFICGGIFEKLGGLESEN
jgi:hypothetical protein